MGESKKGNLHRAFAEDGALKTHVGGQALLEGIMMRGKYNWAVAVREPEGSIYLEEHDLGSGSGRKSWTRWPLVRGCVAMVDSLALGFKALEISAEHAFGEEGQAEPGEEGQAEPGEKPDTEPGEASDTEPGEASAILQEVREDAAGEGVLSKTAMGASMLLGVVLAVVLFIVAPAFVTNLIVGEYDASPVAWNIVDGILRVAVFVVYIWAIGRMGDIKRMFAYHGAEHKTIHCFEHGLELTPANARSFPRMHVRCGTAFIIMVMIIAIIVYTVIPVKPLISAWGVPDGLPKLLLVIAVRIVFLPVIAGVSYEITVKWAGSHPDNPIVRVVLWPGMMMQYLTTNEPDDSMLECAIAAMRLVLERESREAS